jgi:hypothetical protein
VSTNNPYAPPRSAAHDVTPGDELELWLRNFVNALLGVIPLYGLVDPLFIFGVRRQCVHHLIADTMVIRA